MAELPAADREELVAALGGAAALAQAIDVDEVAATLESVGVTDSLATDRFGSRDVFHLADRVWQARSRLLADATGEPARPPVAASPLLDAALARGLAYVVPAVVVAAAVLGGADETLLVVASVGAWGLAQAGGVLAFTALLRAPGAAGIVPLRRGLLAAATAAVAGGLGLGWWRAGSLGAAVAGTVPLLHLVGVTGLVVAGRGRQLLGLLTPVALLSAFVVLVPGTIATRAVGPACAATVATTLAVVARLAFRGTDGSNGRLLEPADWIGAAPLAASGWCTAAFALASVGAVGRLAGVDHLDNRQWLVLGLPLWAMVGIGEWFILGVRQSIAEHLEASETLDRFGAVATRTVVRASAAGGAVLAGAVGVASGVAVATSDLPLGVAVVAAAGFAIVAVALYGATVLTASGRAVPVLATLGGAASLLAWVAARSPSPAGHAGAAVVAVLAAAALCLEAGRTLVDPASHR